MPLTGAPTDESSGSAKSGGRSLCDLMNPPVRRRERQKRKIYYVSKNTPISSLHFIVWIFYLCPQPCSILNHCPLPSPTIRTTHCELSTLSVQYVNIIHPIPSRYALRRHLLKFEGRYMYMIVRNTHRLAMPFICNVTMIILLLLF